MTLYYLGNRSKLLESTDSVSDEPTTNCTSICSDFIPDKHQKCYQFCTDIIEEQKSELEESPVKMPSDNFVRKSTMIHPMQDLDDFVPSFVGSPNKSHDEILYNVN